MILSARSSNFFAAFWLEFVVGCVYRLSVMLNRQTVTSETTMSVYRNRYELRNRPVKFKEFPGLSPRNLFKIPEGNRSTQPALITHKLESPPIG
jgi:hypothetical protein